MIFPYLRVSGTPIYHSTINRKAVLGEYLSLFFWLVLVAYYSIVYLSGTTYDWLQVQVTLCLWGIWNVIIFYQVLYVCKVIEAAETLQGTKYNKKQRTNHCNIYAFFAILLCCVSYCIVHYWRVFPTCFPEYITVLGLGSVALFLIILRILRKLPLYIVIQHVHWVVLYVAPLLPLYIFYVEPLRNDRISFTPIIQLFIIYNCIQLYLEQYGYAIPWMSHSEALQIPILTSSFKLRKYRWYYVKNVLLFLGLLLFDKMNWTNSFYIILCSLFIYNGVMVLRLRIRLHSSAWCYIYDTLNKSALLGV